MQKKLEWKKYISKIEKFLKIDLVKSNKKASKNEKTTKKIIKIKLGPNNVHTILDSLEIEH